MPDTDNVRYGKQIQDARYQKYLKLKYAISENCF